MWYAILKNKQVVPVSGLERAWQDSDERRVARTEKGNILVSTVFLNLNHGLEDEPLWFETMAFEDGDEIDCERYETYEQAVEGHQAMCDKVFVLDADVIE